MQQVIVIIIGIFILGYLIYSLYTIITKKQSDNKCGGCDGGCDVIEKK